MLKMKIQCLSIYNNKNNNTSLNEISSVVIFGQFSNPLTFWI